jgi:hypothetical protein
VDQSLLSAAISASAALTGGFVGALVSYAAARRSSQLERAKLIVSWNKSTEVEKTRIAAYVELWKCLGPISTYNSSEIVTNLPSAQRRLQDWYYDQGGGLLITGSAQDPQSAKAAFFTARDLRSSGPYEIWEAFHHLRRSIRRDLGVFESEADEIAAVQQAKKRLGKYSI